MSQLEDIISDRREFFNESINLYNIGIHQFPDLFFAKIMNYNAKSLLIVSEQENTTMEFSIALPPFMLNFLDTGSAGIFLIFICCFGILLVVALFAICFKRYQQTNFYNLFMLPIFLTWPISTISTVVLNALDVEPIKIITMIVLIYGLMIVFCLLNMKLLLKFIESNRTKEGEY